MCALQESKYVTTIDGGVTFRGYVDKVSEHNKGIALTPVVHRGGHIRTRKPAIYNIPGHCQNMIKISLGGRNTKTFVDSGAHIFDIYFTEYGTALTTILPILFLCLNAVIVTAGTFEP